MDNDLYSNLEYLKRLIIDHFRYYQSRITSKHLVIFTIGAIVFFLVYQHWFEVSEATALWTGKSRVYFSSLKALDFKSYSAIKRLREKTKAPTTCLIIIRSADGALGNRMFLFASAYGLARLHQCTLYVAPWILTDLRSVFLVQIDQTKVQLTTNDSVWINRTDIYGRYSACTLYSDLFRIPLNATFSRYEMIGFYQAYGYFEKYKEEIAFLFQFNQEAIVRNVALVDQLMKGQYHCVDSIAPKQQLYV